MYVYVVNRFDVFIMIKSRPLLVVVIALVESNSIDPHAVDDDYIWCRWPGCDNKILIGKFHYDAGGNEVFCEECLNEMPAQELLELDRDCFGIYGE